MKATFEADFSSFVAETNKATAALARLEQEANKITVTTRQVGEGLIETSATFRNSFGLFAADGAAAFKALTANLGSGREMLNGVAEAAGITFQSLGALKSAGLAAGAAFAGWEVGRKIAELTGSDQIIANLTTSLLGMNPAAAVAASHMDELALATQRAKTAITDLNEARRINLGFAQAQQRAGAEEAGIQDVREFRRELNILRDQGVLPGLTRDLAAHNFSIKELADRYKLSVPALQYYQRQLQAQQADEKRNAAIWAEMNKELEQRTKLLEQQLALWAKVSAVERGAALPRGSFGQSTGQIDVTALLPARAAEAAAAGRLAAGTLAPETQAYLAAQQQFADAQTQYNREIIRLIDLESQIEQQTKQRITLSAQREEAARKLAQAQSDLADKIIKAMGGIPDIGHGPDVPTAWSSLVPKPINISPIQPGTFGLPPINVTVTGTIAAVADKVGAYWMRQSGRNW